MLLSLSHVSDDGTSINDGDPGRTKQNNRKVNLLLYLSGHKCLL